METKYNYLLSVGHGGVKDGVYQTADKWWKKSYFKNKVLLPNRLGTETLEQEADEKFYEGEWNRKVRDAASKKLMDKKIFHTYINDSENDVMPWIRARQANVIAASTTKKCILFDIHANAAAPQAHGAEVYTSKGWTSADPIGQIACEETIKEFGSDVFFRKDLSDGDYDKEADFAILTNTAMPAVLFEFGFYTNYKEMKFLNSAEGIDKCANIIVNTILRCESEINI